MPLGAAAMSSHVKKIISVASCVLVAVLLIIILHFAAPEIAVVPETSGTLEDRIDNEKGFAVVGEDVTAVRISDLGDINKITKVNYVADKFVYPGSITDDVRVVDLTKPFEFAEKGTLMFIIMNLDPESPDFFKQSKALYKYKIGEYWHFEFSLPNIFCASNVYYRSNLIARHGEIADYSFIDYTTSYDKKTEELSSLVERSTIDLKFYTKRDAIEQPHVITIHYQAGKSGLAGIAEYPLIGAEKVVEKTFVRSQNMLIAFTVVAAVALAVLIVLSLLKRTKTFLAVIVWLMGICLMLYPKFILRQSTAFPLLWSAISQSSVFLTLGGALFAFGMDVGKIPAKYICVGVMSIGWITAFICPFVPFAAASVLSVVYTVVKGVGALALFAFACLAVILKKDKHGIWETSTAAVIAVATVASIFMPQVFPVYVNSNFWLCIFAIVTTFIGVLNVFRETERANSYLTSNLFMEVDRQLKDIRSVISERDNLLRFVSHDMKKPLNSSVPILDTLIEREKDAEQSKALQIVRQNNNRVISNLSEIGTFARYNYIAEPSQIADLFDLCAHIFDFHMPDCNANGIVLKNTVNKHYNVFVKKQGLENAVSNIVLNAIEHANCNNITLSAGIDRNRVILCIADDGKGIDDDVDVFKPYVSESTESNGLGLYICKNIIESMNGELYYESGSKGTSFYITMLMA